MRIAQIAPLQVSVPPKQYGGTERCISNLTEALVQMGHEVTLFATGDSNTGARLVASTPRAIYFDPAVNITAIHIRHLAEVYRRADEFDVIHSHLDYLSLPFAACSTTPTVLTLHGRLDLPEYLDVFRTFRDANYVSISASQRNQAPDLNWVATVHHSVDVASFPFYSQPEPYLAWVGRMSPEKGPAQAIEVARRTGLRLKMAAKVDAHERSYFEAVVRPHMSNPLIEWLGEVNEDEKRELMGHALAVLMPITWPEPFGIVFIEAIACGTPVLTCPLGSVPELLQDGKTGFIRATVDGLVEAVGRLSEISRAGCRTYARERFDLARMASDYLAAYERVQPAAQSRRRKAFTVSVVRAKSDGIDMHKESALPAVPATAASRAAGASLPLRRPLPNELLADELLANDLLADELLANALPDAYPAVEPTALFPKSSESTNTKLGLS